MYENTDSRQPIKFTESWLDLRSSDKNSWTRYWCVLKYNVIYLFNSQRESKESLVGTITLGPESSLEKLEDDQRSGYTFNLRTKRRLNTFRASKSFERELWRASVEGIAHGKVNDNYDLLPGQIEDIRLLLNKFLNWVKRTNTTLQTSEPNESNLKDGVDTPNSSTSGSYYFNDGYLVPTQKRIPSDDISQKYQFSSDPSRNDIPSWFFPACSRELSIQILTACSKFGNTLMRESEKNRLVISKRMETAVSGQEFTHYILNLTPQGYKVDVENKHEPMQTLNEVMDFFVATSGKSTTRLMTCNDLKVLGIVDPVYNDYNKMIVASNPDPDSGEEIADTDVNGFSLIHSERGPPDVPAPPLPHNDKKIRKQPNTIGPHGLQNKKSMSVPQFNLEDLKQIQAKKLSHVSTLSRGSPHSHIMRTNLMEKQESSPLLTFKSDTTSFLAQHQNTSKNPSTEEDKPPPLPPNHPPPFNQSSSQLARASTCSENLPSSVVKKTVPARYTQSVSSADRQVRKLSPRGQDSATRAKNELAEVMAKFNRKIEIEDTEPKATEQVKKSEVEEILKSPKVVTENFKKQLEGIMGNKNTPSSRPQAQNMSTDPSDVYESIAHYQNFNEIQNTNK